MDGKILANSLISLRGSNLRIIYALLIKTNISDFLSSKAKDVLTKEGNEHFYKHINNTVKQLENIPDTVLQVDLFLEITNLLKLKGKNYSHQEELEEQCTRIINDIYDIQRREDLAFRALNVRYANLSKLQQLVIYQISRLFQEFDNQFKHFSVDKQIRFSKEINTLIKSLPKDVQEKIRNKFGMEDLTNDAMRNYLNNNGIVHILSIIVDEKGFHFYSEIMALITTYMSPNKECTMFQSDHALLGIYLKEAGRTYHNKVSKKKILPIIVVQICLPYMVNNNTVEIKSFMKEWEKRLNHYIEVREILERVTKEVNEVKNAISKIEDLMKSYNRKISEGLDRIHNRKQVIKLFLTKNMKQLQINQTFMRHKENYFSICEKIATLQREKKSNNERNIIKRIGKQISNIPVTLDIKALEKEKQKSLDLLVEDVLQSNSNFMEEEREAIEWIENEMKQWQEKVKYAKEKKRSKEIVLKKLKQNMYDCIQQCKSLERKNYGIRDLYIKTTEIKKI